MIPTVYGIFDLYILVSRKLDRICCKDVSKYVKIKNAINCRDHGVYAARCKECSDFYVGQTKNAFSTRWNSHRHNWRQMVKSKESGNSSAHDENWKEQNALFLHYRNKHRDIMCETLELSDAYAVIFVESPKPAQLDLRENFWINKLKATINITKTCLPKYQ